MNLRGTEKTVISDCQFHEEKDGVRNEFAFFDV